MLIDTLEPPWLKILVDVCAIVGVLVGIISARLAVRTFRSNARVKRAEWLKSLHAQFYESEKYSDVRRLLDYRPEPDFSRMKEAILKGGRWQHADREMADRNAEALGVYLNFFEFVACLWKLDQLSLQEIMMLFQYYIELFGHKDLEFVRGWIEKYGFENLMELINAVRDQKGKGQ